MCPKPKPWLCILLSVLFFVVFAFFIAFSSSRSRTVETTEVSANAHESPERPRPLPARGPRPGLRIPSVMMDLFHRGPHEQIAAEIVRGLTPRTVGPVHHRYPETQAKVREHLHLLTFDIPRVPAGEVLHSAQLRLTLAFLDWGQRPARDLKSTVSVYWGSTVVALSLNVRSQASEQRVALNCTKLIDRFHHQWDSHGGELQLVVGVTMTPRQNVHPLVSGDHVDQQPLLLLLYSPASPSKDNMTHLILEDTRRERRDTSAEDYEEETNRIWSGALVKTKQKRQRNICRRKPLYVEFADIHYDSWIVAPSGYQAYQCVGKCFYPLSDHLTPTKHAIIQTLLYSQEPTKTQRACCVPTKLDSISILYLDSQGVLTYRLSYRDMVVAECGCR